MNPSIGSALISGVSSLFGGMSGNAAAVKAVQEQNRGNMELAKYAYSQNLAQWERENQYNTPAAQLARMRDAGLNPNLMYGDTNAGGISAKSPTYDAPHLSAYTGQGATGQYIGAAVGDTINKYIAAETQMSQNELIKTQAKAQQQQVINMRTQNLRELAEVEKLGLANNLTRATWDTTVRMAEQSLNNAVKTGENMDVQRSFMASQIEKNNETIKQIKANTDFTEAQSRLVAKRIENVAYERAMLIAQTEKVRLDNELFRDTYEDVKNQVMYDSTQADFKSRQSQEEYWNTVLYGTPHLGTDATSQFTKFGAATARRRLKGGR